MCLCDCGCGCSIESNCDMWFFCAVSANTCSSNTNWYMYIIIRVSNICVMRYDECVALMHDIRIFRSDGCGLHLNLLWSIRKVIFVVVVCVWNFGVFGDLCILLFGRESWRRRASLMGMCYTYFRSRNVMQSGFIMVRSLWFLAMMDIRIHKLLVFSGICYQFSTGLSTLHLAIRKCCYK